MQERRTSTRSSIRCEIQGEAGTQVFEAQAFDVSGDGMSFLTSATLPVNAEVLLRYRLASDAPLITARVLIRYQTRERVGVQFLDLKHEAREHTPLVEQEGM